MSIVILAVKHNVFVLKLYMFLLADSLIHIHRRRIFILEILDYIRNFSSPLVLNLALCNVETITLTWFSLNIHYDSCFFIFNLIFVRWLY